MAIKIQLMLMQVLRLGIKCLLGKGYRCGGVCCVLIHLAVLICSQHELILLKVTLIHGGPAVCES